MKFTDFRTLIVKFLNANGTQTSVSEIVGAVSEGRTDEICAYMRKYFPEGWNLFVFGREQAGWSKYKTRKMWARINRFFASFVREPEHKYVVSVRKHYQQNKGKVYDCRTYKGQPGRSMVRDAKRISLAA